MEESKLKDFIGELPIQSKNIAYAAEMLILCPKCQRNNPPNRLRCFYCGQDLEISEVQLQSIKPNLRKLENWEKGFNVINLAKANLNLTDLKSVEIAALLKLENEVLKQILESRQPLPLARTESAKEAQIVQLYLREFGIETIVLSDKVLAADKMPQRLRGIEFFDNKLILVIFNQDQIIEISPEEILLIVQGVNFERKIEISEKAKKKGNNEILETSEMASDEILFDIYTQRNAAGFRIFAKGFDFSALESDKELLAKENIKKLISKLKEMARAAKYVAAYQTERNLISAVWEVEQKTESQGLKREGLGKFNVANLTTINNLSQFTKYSRLQWHLL